MSPSLAPSLHHHCTIPVPQLTQSMAMMMYLEEMHVEEEEERAAEEHLRTALAKAYQSELDALNSR